MSDETPETPPDSKRSSWYALLPVVFFAGLAGLFFYALSTGDPSNLPSALIGKPAPDLDLPPLKGLVDKDGKPVPGMSAKSMRGSDEITVVNVWASWCISCRQEHPFLTLIADFPGVKLVGIDYKDTPENGLGYLVRFGNPYEAVGVDAKGRAGIEWGVYGVPETFIVDRQGIIRYRHPGPISPEIFEKIIKPAIEKARTPLKKQP